MEAGWGKAGRAGMWNRHRHGKKQRARIVVESWPVSSFFAVSFDDCARILRRSRLLPRSVFMNHALPERRIYTILLAAIATMAMGQTLVFALLPLLGRAVGLRE